MLVLQEISDRSNERSSAKTLDKIKPTICGINGPIITIQGEGFFIAELVYIDGLPGEVIALAADVATIQLYENSSGLTYDATIEKTSKPMSITLRPGLLGGIFDGIMRPLTVDGSQQIESLQSEISHIENPRIKTSHFATNLFAKKGQFLKEGDVFATVQETGCITYKATVPPGVSGEVIFVAENGDYAPQDEILTLKGTITSHDKILTFQGLNTNLANTTTDFTQNSVENTITHTLTLSQSWPIRTPRPVAAKHTPNEPLVTGLRVIDSLFPVAKGGTCAIPGGFGTGKTMTQHQIAKHCDADIIIYIGCGERGNEMTDVLDSFSKLVDPRTGAPLLSRMVLIANTSDMPVAAREASIYTGITVAEGFRDMGYHVAVFADSTSRWAEALRELSARLNEIPAEEGYPAYLAARLAAFYSRAGVSENLDGSRGSITIIGAVSPQGGDFSEPVTLQTKRFTRCFWALDKNLAYARQFPAINPLQSYTSYDMYEWFAENIHENFPVYREKILKTIHEEAILLETVKLIGTSALSLAEKQTLATAKEIRNIFTAQNALDSTDAFCPLKQQFEMIRDIVTHN